jgi:hypothetical protein
MAGKLDLTRLAENFLPASGEPLTWHLAAAPDVLVRPFYAEKEGEPYLLTLDPRAANRISFREVTFTGAWNQSDSFRFSNVVGATGSRWGWSIRLGRAEVCRSIGISRGWLPASTRSA